MAFWSKKDSDDEIRISKEEYEDLTLSGKKSPTSKVVG